MSKPPISDEIVEGVKKDLSGGLSQREVAKKYAVSRWFVSSIVSNRRKEKPAESADPNAPRRVLRHKCLKCRNWINIEPCQICLALAAKESVNRKRSA